MSKFKAGDNLRVADHVHRLSALWEIQQKYGGIHIIDVVPTDCLLEDRCSYCLGDMYGFVGYSGHWCSQLETMLVTKYTFKKPKPFKFSNHE